MFTHIELITRKMLQDNPNTLFVFGDNMIRQGLGGQAKAMRGEPNAVGIPTKWFPSMQDNAFLSDDNFPVWSSRSAPDILRLLIHEGNIVWPQNDIGTGKAKLIQHAPKIMHTINKIHNALCILHNASTQAYKG